MIWEQGLQCTALGCLACRSAVQFWMHWSLAIKYFGDPVSSELQLSNRQVTKAWIRAFVLSTVKYSLILTIFRKWNKADLQTEITCLFSDKVWSKTTPMFLTLLDGWTQQSPTRMLSNEERGRYLELITSSSVLSLFNLSSYEPSNDQCHKHKIQSEQRSQLDHPHQVNWKTGTTGYYQHKNENPSCTIWRCPQATQCKVDTVLVPAQTPGALHTITDEWQTAYPEC